MEKLYTKKEVKELLEKQRKLSLEKAKPDFYNNCGACSQHPQIILKKRYIHTAIITIDADSILKAKLKF